jgi:hypothetical protein
MHHTFRKEWVSSMTTPFRRPVIIEGRKHEESKSATGRYVPAFP